MTSEADLGPTTGRYRLDVVRRGTWLPAAIALVAAATALGSTLPGRYPVALELAVCALFVCAAVWLGRLVRTDLKTYPLIVHAAGFSYHDGRRSHLVRFSEIAGTRQLTEARGFGRWNREITYVVVTSAGDEVRISGWRVRNAAEAIRAIERAAGSLVQRLG